MAIVPESLSFGFMVEHSHNAVYRIWGRLPVTK